MTLGALAEAAEVASPMTVSAAVRRFAERLKQQKSLRKGLARAIEQLQQSKANANV